MVYWLKKSGVAAMRVTRMVPLPVSVPAPLMITAAAGEKIAPAPTVKVPVTEKFVLAETIADELLTVKLLNTVAVVPPIFCAAVPPIVTVDVPWVKAPQLRKSIPTNKLKFEVASVVPAEIVTVPLAVVAAGKVLMPEAEVVILKKRDLRMV